MRYKSRRKRIVRTFEFNRILAFATLVCFAVALVAVLLSIRPGGDYISVDARDLYAVSVGSRATESEARSLAADCSARGGAGYVFREKDRLYVFAALYETEAEAQKVAGNITGEVMNVTVDEFRIEKSADAEQYAGSVGFCLHTLIGELISCAADLDKGETSEAAAVLKCRRLKESVLSLKSGSGGDSSFAAKVDSLLDSAADILSAAAEGSGRTTSKIRYAQCALTEAVRGCIAALALKAA